MTEQNQPPGAPSPAPGGGTPLAEDEPKGTPHVEPGMPLFDAPKAAKDTGRFAVYDRRLGKYVGGVSADRPSKADAKTLAGHDDVAIVEV